MTDIQMLKVRVQDQEFWPYRYFIKKGEIGMTDLTMILVQLEESEMLFVDFLVSKNPDPDLSTTVPEYMVSRLRELRDEESELVNDLTTWIEDHNPDYFLKLGIIL
jgi:hypothetical protein